MGKGTKYTPNMHWNIFRNEKPSSTSPATKQPTTAPTAKPKASPAKKPTGYVCTGNKVNLGTKYNGVGQCAAAARKDPRCTGIATMMAKQHPSWGCRCCLAGARYTPYPDKTWSINQDPVPLYKSGYICTQKKDLGQSYPSGNRCLIAALMDLTCGNSVMYNKFGCRCCVKGTKYTPNMHWNIFRNEKPSPTGWMCTGNKVNLGTKYGDAGQCLAASQKDPRCTGIAVMTSPSYPSMGCRCCLAGARYTPHKDWKVGQIGNPLYKSGYICTQKKNLGQSYPSGTRCLAAAL